MNIWRLMSHHQRPQEVAEWIRREGVVAIGWGGTGNLDKQHFYNEAELKRIVNGSHPSAINCANGGRSLWRLYKEMQKGDLVIISAAGSRTVTMRVTGDYHFDDAETPKYYEHRRKAEVVPLDPNRLWQIAGRGAPGEGIYGTLIRCTNSLSEADFNALVD